MAFATEKLARAMNSDSELQKTYGAELAKIIRKRLDDLDAATSLEDMRRLPGRCEELTGNRAGELSVRLTANYRLLFRPNHQPLPERKGGGLDWSRVTAVTVTEVDDYHN